VGKNYFSLTTTAVVGKDSNYTLFQASGKYQIFFGHSNPSLAVRENSCNSQEDGKSRSQRYAGGLGKSRGELYGAVSQG